MQWWAELGAQQCPDCRHPRHLHLRHHSAVAGPKGPPSLGTPQALQPSAPSWPNPPPPSCPPLSAGQAGQAGLEGPQQAMLVHPVCLVQALSHPPPQPPPPSLLPQRPLLAADETRGGRLRPPRFGPHPGDHHLHLPPRPPHLVPCSRLPHCPSQLLPHKQQGQEEGEDVDVVQVSPGRPQLPCQLRPYPPQDAPSCVPGGRGPR